MFYMEHFSRFELSKSFSYHEQMTTNLIKPLCAFKDNYIWLLPNAANKTAWVVDPGDAVPVIAALNECQFALEGILITHHHHDHSGGVLDLIRQWPNLRVVASHKSTLSFVTEPVAQGAMLMCGTHRLNVLEIPGHTIDHIAFYNTELVFCGDTLFSAGCGRVFEGSPAEMYQSLQKLRDLPGTTEIYCGHEYTLANLQFATLVEPNNRWIQKKLAEVSALRANNRPTLPARLLNEKQINPFLRCEQPDVIRAAERYSGRSLKHPVDVFRCLREWKNTR